MTSQPIAVLDSILFVRWTARPDETEVQAALDAMIAARRAAGRPLVLLSIVPVGAPIPDRVTREALHGITALVDQLCEAQYAVFQGTSLRARIVRAFLIAIGLTMRSTVDIVADVETALRLAARRLGVDPDTLAARARERGLLD